MDPMDRQSSSFYDEAVMDDARDNTEIDSPSRHLSRSPLPKARSLSDGGSTPVKLIPSPHIRRTKDDSSLKETTFAASSTSASTSVSVSTPTTPCRSEFPRRGLSLQVPPHQQREFGSPVPQAGTGAYFNKPAPLSPKLDPSQVFASPTNILPRRSRGLDFSRAATSLHHSTLAEQSSPDSSPTVGGGRAMNIPGRRNGDFMSTEQSSSSLWSMMGGQERMGIPSSLGSVAAIGSDSSSSSDDDLMDEDMDEAYITTPQARHVTPMSHHPPAWAGSSPAVSSLVSFQHRQRPKKQPKKRLRGALGLGFGTSLSTGLSRSPPNSISKDGSHSRRESISWQANQLHISGSEGEEGSKMGESLEGVLATPSRDGQRSVIRRVVTRRGNLLPKTKGFARIRAALAEESAPVEAEICREAEVVRQVRESDMDLEARVPAIPPLSATTTSQSSPNIGPQECPDDVGEDEIITDPALGIGSFKQHAMKNSKGKVFWDTFSESSGSIAGSRTTPPPPSFRPRGSSSGISEDVMMDSPILAATAGFAVPMTTASSDSQRSDIPQAMSQGPLPPSVAEITRRINSKRRRDDDFDPVSIKRRAVSPGMSVHNSPIMQSPLQRDNLPWGSRPGSNGGDKGGSSAPSEAGSLSGTPGNASGNASSASTSRVDGRKVRVGFQGMVDTNDGLMRMSIE